MDVEFLLKTLGKMGGGAGEEEEEVSNVRYLSF